MNVLHFDYHCIDTCHDLVIVNGGFFEREGQIIDQAAAGKLAGIPGIIVQGRYDIGILYHIDNT